MPSMRKLMVAGAVAALFTTAEAAEAKHGACKADVEKLCKDVQPGEGRVVACLKEHKAEVSPKCTSFMKEVQHGLKQVTEACEPDVEKYCFDAPIGKGGLASCLQKHSADLSPACKEAVAKVRAGK